MPEQDEVSQWLKKAEDDLAAQIFFLKDLQKEHDLEILLNSLKSHLKYRNYPSRGSSIN